MSGFRKFESHKDEDAGPVSTRCHASGCPCRATVSLGGAPECCSFHAWAEPKLWPVITSGMLKHEYMIGFIGDISRLYAEGRANDALQMAHGFWAEYPELQPNDDEARKWPHYVWRMREHFAFLVGGRGKAVEPIKAAPMPRRAFGAMPAGVREVSECA
jgi:hypothetical protein